MKIGLTIRAISGADPIEARPGFKRVLDAVKHAWRRADRKAARSRITTRRGARLGIGARQFKQAMRNFQCRKHLIPQNRFTDNVFLLGIILTTVSRLANHSLNIISDLSININLAIHDIHRSCGLSLRPLPISGLPSPEQASCRFSSQVLSDQSLNAVGLVVSRRVHHRRNRRHLDLSIKARIDDRIFTEKPRLEAVRRQHHRHAGISPARHGRRDWAKSGLFGRNTKGARP